MSRCDAIFAAIAQKSATELIAYRERGLAAVLQHVHDVNAVWLTAIEAVDKRRGVTKGAYWLSQDSHGTA